MARMDPPVYPALPPSLNDAVGVTLEQLAANRDPKTPIHRLIGDRFIGDPYTIWKDDLELARHVNEELSHDH